VSKGNHSRIARFVFLLLSILINPIRGRSSWHHHHCLADTDPPVPAHAPKDALTSERKTTHEQARFTAATYAISNLQNKRLKLSTPDDLNDPFDLYAVDTTDPAVAQAMEALAGHLKKTAGMLCFSRNWDNLLLWSHYGDSHTGVCLGFDIPHGEPGDNYDTDVLYQPNVLPARRPEDLNPDFADRILRTKHESWSYEQEVRMFVGVISINRCKRGLVAQN
jgi:hypothetical protein